MNDYPRFLAVIFKALNHSEETGYITREEYMLANNYIITFDKQHDKQKQEGEDNA